ncbi:hypothetical protein NE237_014926 [Protea cynaroides]|uniref:Cotton fiber protein n=1 Tax=Protea cynaroides TaxID=273540 RepID=A0A9Q0KD18_9MAGN|nr:hypothetical protein NE237_014926 [Protea cynaroides]
MGKKETPLGRRAWNVLRLALLWARKGGVFKRRLMMDLRLLPSYIKNLRHNNDSIHYREREFSFDDTPLFHFKMHRPASKRFHIPCLNSPSVDFDFDFENDDVLYNNYPDGRKSFLTSGDEREEEKEEHFDGCDFGDNGRRSSAMVSCREESPEEDEGIDLKAEEFIANFYKQMKLQRQISYLQYHDMLNRGAS